MKMLFFLLLTTCIIAAKAQSVITIQHGNTTLFANTLDSAIIKAQNGDYIYLSGGLIATTNPNIFINKSLKIFGAGYHPDSSIATGITQISAPLIFDTGSDSSLLTGIFSTKDVSIASSLTNINITRCNISALYLSPLESNILISENIIRGPISGGSNSSIIALQKNIVYGSVNSCNFYNFLNNIFLQNGPLFIGSDKNTFENNVFLATNFTNGSNNQGNVFNNNIFVIDSIALNSFNANGINNNNIFNQNPINIFVNYSTNSQWTSNQNFHLKPGSIGIGKGKDGTDIGVYGSSLPFKEGGIPFNPHIRSASIATTTNASGKLSINITVTAQNQ